MPRPRPRSGPTRSARAVAVACLLLGSAAAVAQEPPVERRDVETTRRALLYPLPATAATRARADATARFAAEALADEGLSSALQGAGGGAVRALSDLVFGLATTRPSSPAGDRVELTILSRGREVSDIRKGEKVLPVLAVGRGRCAGPIALSIERGGPLRWKEDDRVELIDAITLSHVEEDLILVTPRKPLGLTGTGRVRLVARTGCDADESRTLIVHDGLPRESPDDVCANYETEALTKVRTGRGLNQSCTCSDTDRRCSKNWRGAIMTWWRCTCRKTPCAKKICASTPVTAAAAAAVGCKKTNCTCKDTKKRCKEGVVGNERTVYRCDCP